MGETSYFNLEEENREPTDRQISEECRSLDARALRCSLTKGSGKVNEPTYDVVAPEKICYTYRVMSLEAPYRRKQLLVDRAYQLRFVTRMLSVIFAVALVSSMTASLLLWKNMYRRDLETQALFISSLIAVATTLLIELLIAIPIAYLWGIRQSHRIVGPMERLKRLLAAISEGDFSQRIMLRQGDALEDLATAINNMAERLQQRFPPSPPHA